MRSLTLGGALAVSLLAQRVGMYCGRMRGESENASDDGPEQGVIPGKRVQASVHSDMVGLPHIELAA